MHHNFKGKFYAPVFSVSIGFPYKVNVSVKTFIFQRQLDHLFGTEFITQSKISNTGFHFRCEHFPIINENDSSSTDSNVFVMLNVGRLHNSD